MPELPEVETIKNQLSPCLINQKILSSKIYSPKLRYPITTPPNGCIIKSLVRRSKYIICECVQEDGILGYWILHLGMTGFFQYLEPNTNTNIDSQEKPKHTHVDIYFNNGILRYIDARRFGAMLYTDSLNHSLLCKLGIEPLDISSEELGLYLYKKAQNKKQAIKLFITNNEIVVGIGNIYASEALFESKINPQTLTNSISLPQYETLAKNIQNILKTAIRLGGSTIDNFTHLHIYNANDKDININKQEQNDGNFQIQHKVYGKENKPCYVCNKLIIRIVQGQRSSFFCNNCQI